MPAILVQFTSAAAVPGQSCLHLGAHLSREAQPGVLTQRVLLAVASVPQAPDQLQLGKVGTPEGAGAAGLLQDPLLHEGHGLLCAVMHFTFQGAAHKEELLGALVSPLLQGSPLSHTYCGPMHNLPQQQTALEDGTSHRECRGSTYHRCSSLHKPGALNFGRAPPHPAPQLLL